MITIACRAWRRPAAHQRPHQHHRPTVVGVGRRNRGAGRCDRTWCAARSWAHASAAHIACTVPDGQPILRPTGAASGHPHWAAGQPRHVGGRPAVPIWPPVSHATWVVGQPRHVGGRPATPIWPPVSHSKWGRVSLVAGRRSRLPPRCRSIRSSQPVRMGPRRAETARKFFSAYFCCAEGEAVGSAGLRCPAGGLTAQVSGQVNGRWPAGEAPI
jgi:hypothetical protein